MSLPPQLWSPALHVVDVDDVVDVIALEDDLLLLDERPVPGGIEGVEGGAEVRVDGLVAVVQGEPVEPDLALAAGLPEDLDVRDVVAGPRLGNTRRAGTFGPDPEHPVLQAAPVSVPDKRDLPLRVGDQRVVVVPGRHPEFRVRRVVLQPAFEIPVVQHARLAVQELLNLLDLHRFPSGRSTVTALWTRPRRPAASPSASSGAGWDTGPRPRPWRRCAAG